LGMALLAVVYVLSLRVLGAAVSMALCAIGL